MLNQHQALRPANLLNQLADILDTVDRDLKLPDLLSLPRALLTTQVQMRERQPEPLIDSRLRDIHDNSQKYVRLNPSVSTCNA